MHPLHSSTCASSRTFSTRPFHSDQIGSERICVIMESLSEAHKQGHAKKNCLFWCIFNTPVTSEKFDHNHTRVFIGLIGAILVCPCQKQNDCSSHGSRDDRAQLNTYISASPSHEIHLHDLLQIFRSNYFWMCLDKIDCVCQVSLFS